MEKNNKSIIRSITLISLSFLTLVGLLLWLLVSNKYVFDFQEFLIITTPLGVWSANVIKNLIRLWRKEK